MSVRLLCANTEGGCRILDSCSCLWGSPDYCFGIFMDVSTVDPGLQKSHRYCQVVERWKNASHWFFFLLLSVNFQSKNVIHSKYQNIQLVQFWVLYLYLFMVSYQLRTAFYVFLCSRGIRNMNVCVMVLGKRGRCVTVSGAITDLRTQWTRLPRFLLGDAARRLNSPFPFWSTGNFHFKVQMRDIYYFKAFTTLTLTGTRYFRNMAR